MSMSCHAILSHSLFSPSLSFVFCWARRYVCLDHHAETLHPVCCRYLDEGEVLAHARVVPAAEAHVGEGLLVFLPLRPEPVRVIL